MFLHAGSNGACSTLNITLLFLPVPEEARNLDTCNISDSEVVVSWNEPEVANGAIVRYEVRISHSEQRDNFELEVITLATQHVTTPTTQTSFTDLGEWSMEVTVEPMECMPFNSSPNSCSSFSRTIYSLLCLCGTSQLSRVWRTVVQGLLL